MNGTFYLMLALKSRLDNMSEEELKQYIISLTMENHKLRHSFNEEMYGVLTSNTYPIKQKIEINTILSEQANKIIIEKYKNR